MARPSAYTPEKAKATAEAITMCFSRGQGLAAVARELGVSRSTIYRWVEKDEELRDTLELGKDMSLAWWEDVVLDCAVKGKGNAPLIKMHLYNKHPDEYVERQEIKLDAEVGVFEIDFTGYKEDDAEDEQG